MLLLLFLQVVAVVVMCMAAAFAAGVLFIALVHMNMFGSFVISAVVGVWRLDVASDTPHVFIVF